MVAEEIETGEDTNQTRFRALNQSCICGEVANLSGHAF